jgi:hypothetical protein
MEEKTPDELKIKWTLTYEVIEPPNVNQRW